MPGGVCPFGVNEGVAVYLGESLRKFDTVYPAAGNGHTAVKLTFAGAGSSRRSRGLGGCLQRTEGEKRSIPQLDEPFCVIFYNKLGSFPCIHSATLTGRTYTPLAV